MTSTQNLPSGSTLESLPGQPIASHFCMPRHSRIDWTTIHGRPDQPYVGQVVYQLHPARPFAPYAIAEPMLHATFLSKWMRDPLSLNRQWLPCSPQLASVLVFCPDERTGKLLPRAVGVTTRLPKDVHSGRARAPHTADGTALSGFYAGLEQAALKLKEAYPHYYDEPQTGYRHLVEAFAGAPVTCAISLPDGRPPPSLQAVADALRTPESVAAMADKSGAVRAVVGVKQGKQGQENTWTLAKVPPIDALNLTLEHWPETRVEEEGGYTKSS